MSITFNPRVQNAFDPAHDVYRYTPRSLQPIFSPKSVAVIGATEKAGSVGRTVLWNLISSPFRRDRLSRKPETGEYPGHQSLSRHPGHPRPDRPGGDRHTSTHCPGYHR
jgi:hypothetical protein